MSETRWTEGPWAVMSRRALHDNPTHIVITRAGDYDEDDSNNSGCVIFVESNNHSTPDQRWADAALVAAAPDLYEALSPVLRGADEADYYCPDDVAEDHTVLVSFTVAELRAARAALLKASPPEARTPQARAEDSHAGESK